MRVLKVMTICMLASACQTVSGADIKTETTNPLDAKLDFSRTEIKVKSVTKASRGSLVLEQTELRPAGYANYFRYYLGGLLSADRSNLDALVKEGGATGAVNYGNIVLPIGKTQYAMSNIKFHETSNLVRCAFFIAEGGERVRLKRGNGYTQRVEAQVCSAIMITMNGKNGIEATDEDLLAILNDIRIRDNQ